MSFNLFKEVQDELAKTGVDQNHAMPGIPKPVTNFLGRLSLLHGVPLYNLIPDERYLPKKTVLIKIAGAGKPVPVEMGSLKLFWLDTEWIECLIDGALSTGDDFDTRELLLDKSMAGNYAAEVYYDDCKEQIKKQIAGLYDPVTFKEQLTTRLLNKHIQFAGKKKGDPVDIDKDKVTPTVAQGNWCYTGFIMRSLIIASWVGVEVVAWGNDPELKEQRPLQVIKFERIAADTIFCICEGIVGAVQITQPSETVHFDLEESKGQFVKNGQPVSFRNAGGIDGVVNVSDLKTKLTAANSANFAKSMLSKPLRVMLDIPWSEDRSGTSGNINPDDSTPFGFEIIDNIRPANFSGWTEEKI